MGRRARMRKLREEDLEELAEQLEAEPEKAAPQATKSATTVDKALELQKTAGNRAVGAALSRWPGFGATLVRPVAEGTADDRRRHGDPD